MRRNLVCLLLSLLCLVAKAQQNDTLQVQPEGVDSTYLATLDSLMEAEKVQEFALNLIQRYEELRLKEEMRFSFEGVQPLLRGIIMSFTERGYHNIPAQFKLYSRRYHYADYLPAAAPLATAWALRLAGVESRSTPRRMATASALSVILTAGLTCGLNGAVNELSPDYHTHHAFPSGHAALAFASAAILSREYGHYSPWVTVGSYACATATQLLRLHHNRHWVNDVFMGAGIGVLSTNLAYFITDKIYGPAGINRIELRKRDLLRTIQFIDRPTGLRLLSGTEVGDRKVTLYADDAEAQIITSAAFSTGLELNFYLNPIFSVDAIVKAATSTAKLNTPSDFHADKPLQGDRLNIYHADLAAHFSAPLQSTVRTGFRPMAGIRHTTACQFFDGTSTFRLPAQTRFTLGFGIDLELLSSRNYLLGFTGEYQYTFNAHFSNRYTISSFWKLFF